MLVPAKANLTTKERSHKWDAIRVSNIGGSKIFLTLLAEVVIFYVGLIIVEVGESSF